MVFLCPGPFRFEWALEINIAIYFGIYYDEKHDVLISYDVLKIYRFTSGGTNIFSENFNLKYQ